MIPYVSIYGHPWGSATRSATYKGGVNKKESGAAQKIYFLKAFIADGRINRKTPAPNINHKYSILEPFTEKPPRPLIIAVIPAM